YRKNLFLCIISHGVTNFVLGIYVFYSEKWIFW
ncbi:MAG: CPBP family intramembrane metalloprotease, partial [Nitrospiraceae bacterium]